ncbi:MAG: BrnA antitoxin family protein [Acidobacteria bacterium]|nr:BrnA antitoxin family protein [Acidobacteriota bacterium]
MRKQYDFTHAKRGAVDRAPVGKTRITIRLDDEILDWFRDEVTTRGGGNYQTMINDALREHVRRQKEPLEATLRRVLREELRRRIA